MGFLDGVPVWVCFFAGYGIGALLAAAWLFIKGRKED